VRVSLHTGSSLAHQSRKWPGYHLLNVNEIPSEGTEIYYIIIWINVKSKNEKGQRDK
jgi:hypothetical protein